MASLKDARAWIQRAGVLIAGMGLLMVLCAVFGYVLLSWAQPETVMLPEPTGPYVVGRLSEDWIDRDRPDPLSPSGNIPRALPVTIWYPADAATTAPRAPYLPPRVREAIMDAAVPMIRFVMEPLTTEMSNVTGHSREAPDVAGSADPFPVIPMKPARGGLAMQYAVFAEELASHGYVVVGAEAPYTTRVVAYEDGTVVRRTPKGAPPEMAPGERSALAPGQPNDLLLPVLDVLVQDGSFLVDQVERLNADPSARFTGRLDVQSLGAFGHSIGGATALQFCHDDERCQAAINIDGALWGTVVVDGLDKPFLFFGSDRAIFTKAASERTSDEQVFLDAFGRIRSTLPNRTNHVTLLGSGHFNFADSAMLTNAWLAQSVGGLGRIDPHRALLVARTYVRVFFDTYLKGQSEEGLNRLGREFPEVRID